MCGVVWCVVCGVWCVVWCVVCVCVCVFVYVFSLGSKLFWLGNSGKAKWIVVFAL